MFSPSVEILAFTAEQACQLTGLSKRQLSYWDKTEFFSPGHDKWHEGAYASLYTFRDVVGLRTIATIRKRVPLQELRKVGEWLSTLHETPWASLTLYVIGRSVAFKDHITGIIAEASPSRQTIIPIDLEPIAREMEKATARLRERRPGDIGKVDRHRHIAHNSWVLKGTRIPTQAIWGFAEAGYDREAMLREYPQLKAADIDAALEFERKKRKKAG